MVLTTDGPFTQILGPPPTSVTFGLDTTHDTSVHVAADLRLDTPALQPKATILVFRGGSAMRLSVDQARTLLAELDERLRQVEELVPFYRAEAA